MPDLYTVKTEISKNGKTEIKMETAVFDLEKDLDTEINRYIKMTYDDYQKDYGNGIYAKVAVILEEKTGIRLSEEAVRQRILKMRKKC